MSPLRARPMALLVSAVLAGASPACGGAWPREPGRVFLSFKAEQPPGGTERIGIAAYGEYGLTERITLGGQLTRSDDPTKPSRAGAFARYALNGSEASHRFAVSLGVSAPPRPVDAVTSGRLEAALHWGRGFESRLGAGWATATAKILFAGDESRPITDVSALVGVRPAPGWMAMLSVSRYRDASGPYVKITPSIAYELRPEIWLVPSVTQQLGAPGGTGLGLSLWASF